MKNLLVFLLLLGGLAQQHTASGQPPDPSSRPTTILTHPDVIGLGAIYPRPGRYYLKLANGKALDADRPNTYNNSCRVQIWDFVAGSSNQQWDLEPVMEGGRAVPGVYQIYCVASGKALDAHRPGANSNGGRVQLWDRVADAPNQQWVLGSVSGKWKVTARPGNKVLDVTGARTETNGTDVQLWEYLGGANQQWILEPVSTLFGWVDMHTHPMSQFSFGNEFFHGNIDGEPPAPGSCNCMHGFVARVPTPVPGVWIYPEGSCEQQNLIRNTLIDKFDPHAKRPGDGGWEGGWPTRKNRTHQQMWWEWLDRARRGGLRTIVALAQHSHALADGLETRGPYDDNHSMEDQIRELIAFVHVRHAEIMDTVTTAARMREVVASGRLAVIIGIEMDNIGNFYSPAERRGGEVYNPNPTETDVRVEIDRLYDLGVRYIFPVHIVNNVFGGAAVYGAEESLLFNLSNFYITGRTFSVEAVRTATSGIAFKEPDFSRALTPQVRAVVDVLSHLPGLPLPPAVMNIARYSYPDPGAGFGHRNGLGLTPLGNLAVRHMMRKGMMIDIDHMSEKCVADVISIARETNYPLNSGHNGPRGMAGDEKARTDAHYTALRNLGGMVGVGTGEAEAAAFMGTYRSVLGKMGYRNVTLGTDAHVGAKLPVAPSASARLTANLPGLEICCNTAGSPKRWDFADYNRNGVSHYGLMPEFLQSVQNAGLTAAERRALFSTSEDFAQMWARCEQRGRSLTTGPFTITPNPIGNFCPATLVSGDREFDGHGPEITGSVTLSTSTDGSQLVCSISLNARETGGDRSTGRGSWSRTLFTAPTGWRISAITSATRTNIARTLSGGGRCESCAGGGCDGDEHTLNLTGPVSRIRMVGDTGGNDISTDADCNCDTRINSMEFRPITVVLTPR